MKKIIFSIDSNGDSTFLVTPETVCFISSESTVRRASHIIPANLPLRVLFTLLRAIFGDQGRVSDFTRTWSCRWIVDLQPVAGPLVPVTWSNRQSAIDFEVDWLQANFL
jgi:hypothetical protein